MAVLMKEIRCGHCGTPTTHPESKLRQVCAHLPESATETERINYCCPHCNNLQHAWIPSKTIDLETQSQLPEDTIPFRIAIECAGKNCRSRISVFAPMKREAVDIDRTQARDRVRKWAGGQGVMCPDGHPVAVPFQVAGVEKISS